MKPYGVNELRKMFLEFFESKGHLKMKSFSVAPLLILYLFCQKYFVEGIATAGIKE